MKKAEIEKAYRTMRMRGMSCSEAHTFVLEVATRNGANVNRADKILKDLVLDDRESTGLFGAPTAADLPDIYKRLGVRDE